MKFTEWTDDGLLRHPIYLGMRDDVKPETVRRETEVDGATGVSACERRRVRGPGECRRAESRRAAASGRARAATSAESEGRERRAIEPRLQSVVDQLDEIERGPNSGTLQLPDGQTLEVSNLRKVFWPKLKITKGDLMRYYVRVAPFILPVVNDRPLIMKRFPNGIDGKAFYQHRAPERFPPACGSRRFPATDVPSRLIGGNLITLLYMTQLAAISQDPWFSRVQSPHMADQCAIDLDPMPGVKFAAVLDVARWVRDELEKLKVDGLPKDVWRERRAHLHPASRRARRTKPARSSARSSRPSSPRSIRRSRP